MVFAFCGEIEALSPDDNVNGSVKNSDGASAYHGYQRGFASPPGRVTGSPAPGHEGEDLVSVRVPAGFGPGQILTVLAPDGSRQVRATIPPGMEEGDAFLIRLAFPMRKNGLRVKPMEPQQPLFSQALESWLTPYPDAAVISPCANMMMKKEADDLPEKRRDPRTLDGAVPTAIAKATAPTPMVKNTNALAVTPAMSPVHHTRKDPTPRNAMNFWSTGNEGWEAREEIESTEYSPEPSPLPSPVQAPLVSSAVQQKLLLVHVPPGMPEGATMHVEVPGENRTLIAQVPPGVSSFHVAYSPQHQNQSSRSSHPAPAPAQLPPKAPFKIRASSPKGQKLLLVRVPKGTAAGTTLHVSVPDEPGRILAAKVPPGNVREFHVSYEARASKSVKATVAPPKPTEREPEDKQPKGSLSVAEIREKYQQPATSSSPPQPQHNEPKQQPQQPQQRQQHQYQSQAQLYEEQPMRHQYRYDSPATTQREGYPQYEMDPGQQQQHPYYPPQPYGSSPVYQNQNRYMPQQQENHPSFPASSHPEYDYPNSMNQKPTQHHPSQQNRPTATAAGGGGWGNFKLPFFSG